MFRNPKCTLRKFRKPQIDLAKISQASFTLRKPCNNFTRVAKISQPSSTLWNSMWNLKKPVEPHFAHPKCLSKALRNLRGFANLFRNPSTRIRNIASSNSPCECQKSLNPLFKGIPALFSFHKPICALQNFLTTKAQASRDHHLKRRHTLLAPFRPWRAWEETIPTP